MSEGMLAAIARFQHLRVLVIGDVILDEYVGGSVDRISPEAPVAVVRVVDSETRLGGAANVARQIAALGATAVLATITGDDELADQLLRLSEAARIDTRHVIRRRDRRTTRKLRVLGHGQQLLRLDWEDARPCEPEAVGQLLSQLERLPAPDVVIISDYAKGVITPAAVEGLVRLAARWGSTVLVDPKQRSFARYRGATTITPNLRELEAATGSVLNALDLAEVEASARTAMRDADVASLFVTLGEQGMLVITQEGASHVPAIRRAVYDVTGAGDTAIALLALSLAANTTPVDAARIANAAAGLAVGQIGTAAIGVEELVVALSDAHTGKVILRRDIAARAASWRMAGKRIVFTNGCFDLLHAGHLQLLREAARQGDVLILAINSDASIRRLKGPDRPLVGEMERAALLAALDCVHAVTVFDEDTPLEVITLIRPQVIVKGADYRVDQVVGRAVVEAEGGRVHLVSLVPEKSTTGLLQRIRSVGT